MRTLKFIVEGQIIMPDPNCDFSNLVRGSKGYLQAEFSFSDEWKRCKKVAQFLSSDGTREFPPQILEDGKTCMIPAEATEKTRFKIGVLGGKDDFKLVTNKVVVAQDGGK